MNENRFRAATWGISGAGVTSCVTDRCPGALDCGTGEYVRGCNVKISGSDSISSSSGSVSGSGMVGSEALSRSETYWKAGRVARIAGVMILGSDGKSLVVELVAETTDGRE